MNNIVEILSFMCETRVNIAGRYDKNRGLIDNTFITNENFNLINKGYTQKNNFFSYMILDSRFGLEQFKTQLTWTKVKSAGALVDNWTNITLTNTLDLDSVLDAINEKTKMLFLCTPNNPTGALISQDELREILNKTNKSKGGVCDAVVVIDEAYFEYSETTNVNLLDEYDNIFILRTMSKVMGLAGMRIGYGISSKEIIEFMHRIKPVFSLTKLSYIAALTTIKDTEYIEKSIKDGIESRDFLYDKISKMKSVKVYKSYSNFMLIDIHDTGYTAAEITREFMKRGMIVRDCTSFKGLDEYYFRISICTLEEDKKFLEVMREILNE
jgi:histidinol-phosphate aminotransferase